MSSTVTQLGFLAIAEEETGSAGGYLVVNAWGWPVDFRYSTAVQPNRVQQILYGPGMKEYLCAELIGKTLIEKSAAKAALVVTDSAAAAPVRRHLEVPVLVATADEPGDGFVPVPHARSSVHLSLPEEFAGDAAEVERLLTTIDRGVDLGEPFGRIREAMTEARTIGVGRPAA